MFKSRRREYTQFNGRMLGSVSVQIEHLRLISRQDMRQRGAMEHAVYGGDGTAVIPTWKARVSLDA